MQSQKKRAAKAAVEFVSFSRKPLEQPLLERLALSYSRMASEISNSILSYIGAKEGHADLAGVSLFIDLSPPFLFANLLHFVSCFVRACLLSLCVMKSTLSF